MKSSGVQVFINNYPLATGIPTLVVSDYEGIAITGGKIIIPSSMVVDVEFSYDRLNFVPRYASQTNVTIPLSGEYIQQIRLTKTSGTGVVTVTYSQGDNPPNVSPYPTSTSLVDGAPRPTTTEIGAINQFYNGTNFDLGRSGLTTPQATAIGMQNDIPYIIYNSTKPVATNGQVGALQGDPNFFLMGREGYAPKAENNPLGVIQTLGIPLAAPDGSWTQFKNLGANATLNIKPTAGNIHSLYCRSRDAAISYLQLFATTTVPAGGAVPDFSFMIPIGTMIIVGNDFFGINGFYSSIGWAFAFSSTENTYTAGTAANHSTWVLWK